MEFRRHFSSSLTDATSESRVAQQSSGRLPALWRSLKAKLDALGPNRSASSLSSSPTTSSDCASGLASPSGLFGDLPQIPAALTAATSSTGGSRCQPQPPPHKQGVQNQPSSPRLAKAVTPNLPRSVSGLPSSLSRDTSYSIPLKPVNNFLRETVDAPSSSSGDNAQEYLPTFDSRLLQALPTDAAKAQERLPSVRSSNVEEGVQPVRPGSTVGKLLAVSPALPRAMARKTWTLEDYIISKRLSKSATSAVYRGTCRYSGMPVALKVYFLSRVPANVLHMIKREIEIHSQLVHKHIARLYGAFMDENERVVLVQEYAAHGDLYEVVQRIGGRMAPQQVADMVMRPFVDALAYLHSKGICHRDIKPENILFSQSWRLLLADFGVSIDLSQERAVTRAGTEGYMAPEVERCPLKSEPEENKDDPRYAYSTAVDIWAVGVLAYELMVGFPPVVMPQPPVHASDLNGDVSGFVKSEMTAAALHFPASVPPAARSFVAAALAADPLERPTAAQLLQHAWLRPPVPAAASRDGRPEEDPSFTREGVSCRRPLREGAPVIPARRAPPTRMMSSQLEGF